MVAASLEGGMTLFNHTIEYVVEDWEDVGDVTPMRTAIITYDDFWGNRQSYKITAPPDVWTEVKVGGTASAGASPPVGVVTDIIEDGVFRKVWIPEMHEITCLCLPLDDDFNIGDTGLVVDYMHHERDSYGLFSKAIMRNLPVGANPNLHSINLLIFNGGDQVGVIHLDPYIAKDANYDHLDIDIFGDFVK